MSGCPLECRVRVRYLGGVNDPLYEVDGGPQAGCRDVVGGCFEEGEAELPTPNEVPLGGRQRRRGGRHGEEGEGQEGMADGAESTE